MFALLAVLFFESQSPLESDDLGCLTFASFEGQTDRFGSYLQHFGSSGDQQIPITRWPKTVQQRSFKISYFLHFLLRRRCLPLRLPLATAFGNSLLQFLSPTPFSSSFSQPKFAIPFTTPVCDSFVRLLFATSFAALVCNTILQVLFATPLQILCATLSWNSSLQFLFETPSDSSLV